MQKKFGTRFLTGDRNHFGLHFCAHELKRRDDRYGGCSRQNARIHRRRPVIADSSPKLVQQIIVKSEIEDCSRYGAYSAKQTHQSIAFS